MVSGPDGSCRILPPHNTPQNHGRRSRCGCPAGSVPVGQETRQESFGKIPGKPYYDFYTNEGSGFPCKKECKKANLYKQSPLFPVELFHESRQHGNCPPERRIDTGKEFSALLPIRKKSAEFRQATLPKTGMLIMSDRWLPIISSGKGAQENGMPAQIPHFCSKTKRAGRKFRVIPIMGSGHTDQRQPGSWRTGRRSRDVLSVCTARRHL